MKNKKKWKILIIGIIVFMLINISYGDDKLKTREDYENFIKQQQVKIETLEKTVSELKKQVLDLGWELHPLKYGMDPNITERLKEENGKLQIIIKDQKTEIQRLLSLFQQIRIDPNSEPNNIQKLMIEKEEKEYQKRLVNYKKYSRRENPPQTREEILRKELEEFFMDITEVKWVKFNDNTIYVGFNSYPLDGNAILRGAALHGNKAIIFGCHVWAVHEDQKNNYPYYGTLNGKWYDEITARYGKIK